MAVLTYEEFFSQKGGGQQAYLHLKHGQINKFKIWPNSTSFVIRPNSSSSKFGQIRCHFSDRAQFISVKKFGNVSRLPCLLIFAATADATPAA